MGWGVQKEGSPAVAGGSRLTLKSFLIWAPCIVRFGGWLPAGLDLSFLHSTQPASYLVGIKTRGEKRERESCGCAGVADNDEDDNLPCYTCYAMLCWEKISSLSVLAYASSCSACACLPTAWGGIYPLDLSEEVSLVLTLAPHLSC